ncbi:MAG: hypothetical protein GXO73_02880 [Calditrichaeota bacterium]|nr:hypothetical protein [Calditrichota bacterium]
MTEHRPKPRTSEWGGMLLPILGSFVSFAIVFTITFYFANGRSFKPRHLREQANADSTETQKVDSLAIMRAQLDSLQRLVDSTAVVLQQLQVEVTRRQEELKNLADKLANAKSEVQQEKLRRARKIATILAALPDTAVAAMAARLPDDLLVAVLQKSREKDAAKLLAAIGPSRAAGLTRKLVNLN